MVSAPEYTNFVDMETSSWLINTKELMKFDVWPKECRRCEQTELINETSIRLNMIEFDRCQPKKDYLMVGGVLDNICNSACQFCSEELSTKIGSLKTKQYPIVDNTKGFWSLPQDRITHLDLNGGEPSHSKNYKQVLANLPKNVQSIRLNTNCSTVLTELTSLVDRGVKVTVTVSFDGVGAVHDYVRWPIKWDKFLKNLLTYQTMPIELNLWTTVNALNIGDLLNIQNFIEQNRFNHSWALLNSPGELNIEYQNNLTLTAKIPDSMVGIKKVIATKENNQEQLDAYIAKQDQLRGIKITDYIK